MTREINLELTRSLLDWNRQHLKADAMQAAVTRLDRRVDRFDAMLLPMFDEAGKVSLWHEVYVQA